MGDFKNKYANTWADSNKKESYIAKYVSKQTGLNVLFCGFGAGETTYYNGAAEEFGFEKGDPDLHIEGTNIFIEVTGPIDVKPIRLVYADLWFRPDKIKNAIKHPEKDTWLCHVFRYFDKKENRIRKITRMIRVDGAFITNYANGLFTTKTVTTKRGGEETFVAIPSDYEGIMYISDFCSYIKSH